MHSKPAGENMTAGCSNFLIYLKDLQETCFQPTSSFLFYLHLLATANIPGKQAQMKRLHFLSERLKEMRLQYANLFRFVGFPSFCMLPFKYCFVFGVQVRPNEYVCVPSVVKYVSGCMLVQSCMYVGLLTLQDIKEKQFRQKVNEAKWTVFSFFTFFLNKTTELRWYK